MFSLTLTLFLCLPTPVQEKTSPAQRMAALVQENTKLFMEKEYQATAIWFPAEFFKVTLEEKGKYSKEEIEKVFTQFSLFNIFAVLASTNFEGQASYLPPKALTEKLQIVFPSGIPSPPLAEESIPAEIRSYIQSLRPSLSAALGASGVNMSIVFFPGTSVKNTRLIDPRIKADFQLKIRDFPKDKESIDFHWKTPLDSLRPSKICPKCKETCKGSWSYCPWDGTKLD